MHRALCQSFVVLVFGGSVSHRSRVYHFIFLASRGL